MSELESKIEQLAEYIVVETPFEDIDELKKLFQQGKTLCWTYNRMNFRLSIWYRENNKIAERFHMVVDQNSTSGGYYSINWGLTNPEQDASDQRKLVKYKLKKIFS